MIEGALRREVMREHRRKRGEGGSPTWDAAFTQVESIQCSRADCRDKCRWHKGRAMCADEFIAGQGAWRCLWVVVPGAYTGVTLISCVMPAYLARHVWYVRRSCCASSRP